MKRTAPTRAASAPARGRGRIAAGRGSATRCLALSLAVLALAAASAGAAGAEPLRGTSLWVAQAAPAPQLAAAAAPAGVRTLIVKAGDGTSADPQFGAALVGGLRAAGISVCAWTFAYGSDPLAEANVAIAAARSGAQCLVVDAEGAYDGRYGAAQLFVRSLRRALGPVFPIALAGQAEVLEHPTFPYSVFLGPGAFQLDMPQIYWRDLGLGVSAAYRACMGVNAIYGRPIVPVGQLYGGPSAGEVRQFAAQASELGSPGVSFFDLDAAEPALLPVLGEPPGRSPARGIALPVIRPGADGDEIVRAQELLNAAGARLPVGGFFGASTGRAVAAFQERHRLARTGLLDPATWRVLLRYTAREPSWAGGPPDSAR